MKDGFWNDTKQSNVVVAKIKSIKNRCETYRKLEEEATNLNELAEFLKEEYDENLAKKY